MPVERREAKVPLYEVFLQSATPIVIITVLALLTTDSLSIVKPYTGLQSLDYKTRDADD